MNKSIAIVGAGWYGCHLTNFLSKLSFDVTLYEMADQIFNGASGSNQNRLHQGYHYPRSHRTRTQSRDGYIRFIERYPMLSKRIEKNYYIIPHYRSNMDFQTYKIIMASAGLEFRDVTDNVEFLTDVEGVLQCEERLILTETAKHYFQEKLSGSLVLNRRVSPDEAQKRNIDGKQFDYVIDCTWGTLTDIERPIFYEKSLLLNYKRKANSSFDTALTFVDGELFSLFPTEQPDIYTLTHVLHTPISQGPKADKQNVLVDDGLVYSKRQKMESDILHYYSSFLDEFEYVGYDVSTKTKLQDSSDDRSCYVEQHNNVITVLSGKIDTVFYASEQILSILVQSEAQHVSSWPDNTH
jgi:hypothetical protein